MSASDPFPPPNYDPAASVERLSPSAQQRLATAWREGMTLPADAEGRSPPAPNSKVASATQAFAGAVQEFVTDFDGSVTGGRHFALRFGPAASADVPSVPGAIVDVGGFLGTLQIKNVDTGEVATFELGGIELSATEADLLAKVLRVELPSTGPSITTGDGPWVHFDTVNRLGLADFAGIVRMPSLTLFGADLHGDIVFGVNVDQESWVDDAWRGDGIDIRGATGTEYSVDGVFGFAGISYKIGSMRLVDRYQGTVDQSRSLWATLPAGIRLPPPPGDARAPEGDDEATEAGFNMEQEATEAGFNMEQEATEAGFNMEQEATEAGFNMEQEATEAGFNMEQEATEAGFNMEQEATEAGFDMEQEATEAGFDMEQEATEAGFDMEQEATEAVGADDELDLNGETSTPADDELDLNGETSTPADDELDLNGETSTPADDELDLNGETSTPADDELDLNGETSTPADDEVDEVPVEEVRR